MFELVLRAPRALVEPVSDLLMDALAASSVSVEDADAGTQGECALFGEPGMPEPAAGWHRSSLKALFETETSAEQAAAVLLARLGAAGLQVQGLTELADQDWVRITQSQFAPVPITPEFWIVPSWHEPPAAAKQVMRLDPGLAFGTGTHPTTRMCLRWLARRPAGASLARVLDYGCGSGILAIGAALMAAQPSGSQAAHATGAAGAQRIDAVDIDPVAVQATRDNAAQNGVTLGVGLPDHAHGTYSVVLANILATPLKLLAPLLAGHLASGGWLVLAGILERQAEEIRDAYAPWLHLAVADSEEGWILMCGQSPVSRQ